MLNNGTKLNNRIAIGLMLIGISFSGILAQSSETPEERVRNFYSSYLKAVNNGKEPTRKVMNSHLSKRFSTWFYSKAGQNSDYDVFVNSQEWNDAWAENIEVTEAVYITANNAALHVMLSAPPDEFVMKLQVNLVKEGSKWMIDRVRGLFE